MERKPNETFEQYKARRAEANIATKNINRLARAGGTTSARRELRRNGNPKGTYGRDILKSFAERRVTPARLETHFAHVQHIANRKARGAAQAQNDGSALLVA